jgi:outer membrane protein assembly factor BamB
MSSSRRLLVPAVLVAGVVVAISGQGSPRDYPQWRGRHRDGSASGFTEPTSWPETLTRRWQVEVGEGYATPLVVGDAVYVFTRRGDDEVMTALDAATGLVKWQTGYPAPYAPSRPTAAHGAGPKATPAFHDGKVFTLGISGIVGAFDGTSGKLVWRMPAPSEAPYFSAAASPVAEGHLVMTHPGNYEPLTAFNVHTGAVEWTAGDGGFFMSPLIVTLAGTRQVVTVTQKNVLGVSITDGRVLWQYPWAGGAGGTMPIVNGDIVVVSGLDLGVSAFRPTRRDESWTVERLWETKEVSMYMSNPVVIGDTLFGFSHRASGQFFALDAKTGTTLWLGTPREAMNSSVVKAGDLLFLLNDDAELIVARSSRLKLEPIRRYTVAESATWAQPAVSGHRVFIKDTTSVALWTMD